MDVLYGRCAGLDVHKKTVVACVLSSTGEGGTRPRKQVRTFSTMTADLGRLREWLREAQVEQVALESTGVYWWPVFNVLEDAGLAVVLVNPQHSKAVPGRKTDVKDSEWLAELLRHGLVRASFIPPAAIRRLRELTRYRKVQVRERASEINRLQKVLESANIKLASVATDVLGASGRLILDALANGEEDPDLLADLAKGKLREKLGQLRQALEGRVQPHHRVLIRTIMQHMLYLEEAIRALDREVARAAAPFGEALTLLETVPGVSKVAARALLAEIGADMDRFASAPQLTSWAGVCPGNQQSGGKRLSGKTTQGNVWLRAILGEVAWAAIRTAGSAFGARYRRIARRQGKQKAVVAVMHHLLTVIFHILRDREPYRELGPEYYQTQDPQRQQRRSIRSLEQLGFTVTLTPKEVQVA
jgi:transposase